MQSNFIRLIHNKGFKWNKVSDFWLKGNIDKAPENTRVSGAFDFLKSNSFGFAWINEQEESIVAATDINRSIPLFYFWDGHEFCLSDDVAFLAQKFSCALDENQISFFEQFGYTSDNHTLYKNIFSLLGGSLLTFDCKNKTLDIQNYISVSRQQNNPKVLKNICDHLWGKIIQQLQNKTAVVPLSGGWDSRFILSALVLHNVKNIICFTYGKADSFEVKTARKICQKLNVQWYFVEYTPELLQCYTSQLGWEYEQFANQFTSIAYEQDFFAIYSLKQKGLFPKNAVFLPGFCGDFYAGSKTIPANINTLQKLIKHTINKNAFKGNIDLENQKIIEQSLQNCKAINLNDSYQKWYSNHKSDKYINNGLRAFEFFDFQWIFPLMDYEYLNFWKNCSEQQLKNKLFYQDFLVEHYFKILGIDFDLKTSEEKVYQNSIVQSIKKIVPKKFKNKLQKVLFKNQTFVNNQNLLAQIFAKDLPNKNFNTSTNENQMHAKWCLSKI